jgi:glycosyltransferase involved in cell wall biosynthesis
MTPVSVSERIEIPHVSICLVFRFAIAPETRAQIASQEHPRVDFQELPVRLHAHVVDLSHVKQSRLPLVIACRFCSATLAVAVLAWTCRRQFDVFYVGDDTTGVLLCALLKFSRKRPRVAIRNHHLSHRWKSFLFRFLGLASVTDALLCLNDFQADFARRTLHVADDRVVQMLYGASVNGAFFTPQATHRLQPRYVLSVGLEARDYETLVSALAGINVPGKIVVSGVREAGKYSTLIPASTSTLDVMSHLSYHDLRDLYAGCAFVVLPLHDSDYPAGATTIMEAMAMGKPVIATRSRGIREYIQDGKTGMWAGLADAKDLRNKILYLWNNPDIAEEMGTTARAWASQRVDLDRYTDELASILKNLEAGQTLSRE